MEFTMEGTERTEKELDLISLCVLCVLRGSNDV